MALTTNTKSQTAGICNHLVGQLVTDATTAAAATISCGFVPRIVRLHNVTDRISQEWYEGMAANNALQTVAAGTRTLDTSNGPVVDALGNVTFPATALIASKTFFWEAIG